MRTGPRRLAELRWQAHKLRTFLRNGGDAGRWFRAKGFSHQDERAIRWLWENDIEEPESFYFTPGIPAPENAPDWL